MVNYHALTSSLKLSGSNVVVLGGTQGIGAGIAIRFAELGSSVLVIGRNETAGNTVVNTMRGASADSSEAKFTFVRGDLGTVDGIRGAADDIAAWAGAQGVDYLFQTQGGPSTGLWPPTPESLTIAFNVQILSHFLIPYLLLSRPQPILRQGAQICNVGRPGEIGRAVNMDDFIGIKAIQGGNVAFVKKLLSWVFIMDLYTQASPRHD
ncbi:hypothetical protein FIBSPDRAFT_590555 [Athelia psychrophila]|uniref:NAD(P)-binding protein n=1 Tax=Athelia psychrophila TaxID=1759441 RepID=A0A166H9P6_9AGAM|nr:hypothetical protein FIBSPDRAFT_590555 [Fibularhizoctonia sp. CBS 109695]